MQTPMCVQLETKRYEMKPYVFTHYTRVSNGQTTRYRQTKRYTRHCNNIPIALRREFRRNDRDTRRISIGIAGGSVWPPLRTVYVKHASSFTMDGCWRKHSIITIRYYLSAGRNRRCD